MIEKKKILSTLFRAIIALSKILLLLLLGIIMMLFSWGAGVSGKLPGQLFALMVVLTPLGIASGIIIDRLGIYSILSLGVLFFPLVCQLLIVISISKASELEFVLPLGALMFSVIGLILGKRLERRRKVTN